MTLSGPTLLMKPSSHHFPARAVCQFAVRLCVITWKLLLFLALNSNRKGNQVSQLWFIMDATGDGNHRISQFKSSQVQTRLDTVGKQR